MLLINDSIENIHQEGVESLLHIMQVQNLKFVD